MKIILTICAALLFSFSANAQQSNAWKINAAQSKLEFKVAQDNSNINGSFKKFSGNIIFDKDQLAKSKIAIDVDISSISMSLPEANSAVQNMEWMAIKSFPKANFTSEKITILADKKTYHADGKLTIKGKTSAAFVEFYFAEYSPTKARANGKATIKRSAYGVGNADLQKANGVKDDVIVAFEIAAEK